MRVDMGGDGTRLRRAARITPILVALAVSGVAFAYGGQNDAGLGLDAGNSVESAGVLAGWGSFTGLFDANDSVDWYEKTIPQASWNASQCVEAAPVSTLAIHTYVVGVTADGDTREAVARVSPARTNFVGVAMPGVRGGFFRVTPDSPTNLSYQLTLSHVGFADLGADDGWGSGDAPSPAVSARPVTRGCLGGKVGSGLGDASDTYSFAAQSGDKLVLTLADNNSASLVQLYSPAGGLVGSVQPGSVGAFTLATSGVHTMTATSPGASSTSYVIGLCEPDCGPPANPCRPMCVLLLGD